MEKLTPLTKAAWIWFVVLLGGFSWQTAYAQADPVTFTFNCIDGAPGDTVCIPVTVENFNNITIAQFEIIWDSEVLHYIEVQNPGSPSINVGSDFNLSGPNALKFIPLGFPISGESQPDGTVLFEICFRVVGIPGSTSPIGISANPFFDFEVADDNGVVPSDSINCRMTVDPAMDLVGFVNSCGPAMAGGDGFIDVTVYGGNAPYTITWLETMSNTPGGPIMIASEGGSMMINGPMGNYDVTVTDALGQTVTYNIDISGLALTATTRLRHPTCYKFDNGTMWIKPAGGEAPFSYIWHNVSDPSIAGSGFIRNPGDSSLVTSLPAGTYEILVKDDNGCEALITAILNYNPFVFTVDDFQDASCNGAEDGLISLTISGATPDVNGDYTVLVNSFEITTNMVTVGLLDPGNYSITVSDAVSQCDTVFSFTIGSATEITATITTTDPPCSGGTNGSVSLRGLTNGVAGPLYSYAIYQNGVLETMATNIGGIFNYSPLSPGNYMAVITEGPCKSDSIPFTINDGEPINVTVEGTSIDNCLPTGSGDAWFEITGGTGPYTLSSTMGIQDGDTLKNLNAGNYVLTVTDDNGCMATTPFQIRDGDDNEEADISFQINGEPCEPGATITVLYQGAPIPAGVGVIWNNNSMLTNPTLSIEMLNSYPETLSVDVILGAPIFCILDDTAIINCEKELRLDITVIDPLCDDEALGGPYTGTVIVDTMNAVAPVTWYWSFPDTTSTGLYTGLAPGTYYVTVTDAINESVVDTFEIVAPPPVHLTFTNIDSTSCNNICDGAVEVTAIDGDPASDYFLYWTTTSSFADTGSVFQINNLCAGSISFDVSQDGTCYFRDSVEILSPEPIDVNLVAANDPNCFGYDDGSIEVSGSGGTPAYTYMWDTGQPSAIATNLFAGEYFITVTDSKNCSAIDSFTLNQPDTLIAQIDASGTSGLSCGASNDGIISVDVSGGNGNYSFTWNPPSSTSFQAINLSAGHYDVTVTDQNGCSDTTSYTLVAPPPIVVTWPDVTPPACFGDETLLLIENVTGGNGSYSFSINSGQAFDIGEPVMIPSGIYLITVFDASGCALDSTYIIMEPNPILVSILPDDPVINLGDSLLLTGQVDQSDNPLAMTAWSSGGEISCESCPSTFVFNSVPTEYTWTVTDENGCQGSATILVDVDYQRDVYIPNVFTPNRDGRNDNFSIFPGQGVKMINYIRIYDRWGNVVYELIEQEPSENGVGSWDGTFKNKPLNPGVYVYVAEVTFLDNDTRLTFRGDVTLIR